MIIPEDATLLRVFLGESDRYDGKPLYEAIVLKARELHLGGATVLRGIMGFGRSSRLHTTKVLRLSEDLPIVVEIADAEEKIQATRRWLRQLPEALKPYQGVARQLGGTIESDLKQAIALLGQKVAALEEYAALTAPAGEEQS